MSKLTWGGAQHCSARKCGEWRVGWGGGGVKERREWEGQMRKSKICRDYSHSRRQSEVWSATMKKAAKETRERGRQKRKCGRVTDWRDTELTMRASPDRSASVTTTANNESNFISCADWRKSHGQIFTLLRKTHLLSCERKHRRREQTTFDSCQSGEGSFFFIVLHLSL